MSKKISLLFAVLVLSASVTAFAAGGKPDPKPPEKVEAKDKAAEKGKTGTEVLDQAESLAGKSGKGWDAIRIERVAKKAGFKVDDAKLKDIKEAASKLVDVRQAVNTLDAAVAKLTAEGGQLSRSQLDLVEAGLDYLAAAKGEKELHSVHMVWEDALQGGYAKKVADALRTAVAESKAKGISLFEASRDVFARLGISVEDLIKCEKTACKTTIK